MKNLQSALTIKYSDFKGPSKCHFHEEYSLNVLSVVFTRSNSALTISQQSKCVRHCGAATVMPSTLEEEPKSTPRPLGSKNVLESRNEEEEEETSSSLRECFQSGHREWSCLRFVYILVCLLTLILGLGLGCLETHLRNRNGKHTKEKNKHQTILSKVLIFFKQQSHQIFACLFVFLCTTLNLWIVDQWCK